MNFRERLLYHQIHPAKLAVDVGVTIPACHFFWQHDLALAIATSLLPPIAVSAIILLANVDLERYKSSRFGRYVATYMTRSLEAVRIAGFAVMALACWFHSLAGVAAGLAVVALAWLRGLIRP